MSLAIKDCMLLKVSTGYKASNLREFREAFFKVPDASFRYHFLGRYMRLRSYNTCMLDEFHNDFAAWAWEGLRDQTLAERMDAVDLFQITDMQALRQALMDRVDERIEENDQLYWAIADRVFYFLSSRMVVLDTGLAVQTPEQLYELIPELSAGSIFYHLIDARLRNDDGKDDFSAWLHERGVGQSYQCRCIESLSPGVLSLSEYRRTLTDLVFVQNVLGGRG